MEKILVTGLIVMVMAVALVGSAMAGEGPLEGAGDGIPNEQGLEDPSHFMNGETGGTCPGPAPNSGDGFPDGPGW